MGRVRSPLPRNRFPLHWRAWADPAALRRWLVVAALAVSTAAYTGRVVSDAEAARRRWGETAPVLVVDRPVEAGQPLEGSVTPHRWPVALVPAGALADLPAGAEAAGPVDPGVPVTPHLVARPGAPSVTGRRHVALALGPAALPLEAGDRVDVWATVDPSLAEGRLTTRRVATDAVVTSAATGSAVVAVAPREVPDVAEAAALATVTIVATGGR